MPREPTNFREFVQQRITNIPDDQTDREYRRALVDFMRSDLPLSPMERQLYAGTLEEHFFPSAKNNKAARQRKAKADVYEDAIRYYTAEKKAEGSKAPKREAEEFVASCFPNLDVDAMKQTIKRESRARKKRER